MQPVPPSRAAAIRYILELGLKALGAQAERAPARRRNALPIGGRSLWNTRTAHQIRTFTLSGRQRLPGGEPRKASQRNKLRTGSVPARISPTWRAGEAIRWKGRAGVFRRDVGDGEHAEIVIAERVYRVRTSELG
jgi:hypothetical protein